MLKVDTRRFDEEAAQQQQVVQHAPIQRSRFSPYVNNGGTVLAVAGADYCIVAGDTRISLGYSIQTRNGCKLFEFEGSKAVLATSGMQADMSTLCKVLRVRTQQYVHNHSKHMTAQSLGQLLSTTLYNKRFFPYYTFNVLGGLDEDGVGCVYAYDAVGSFERIKYNSSGTGSALIMPVLDNQIGHHNMAITPGPLSKEEALELVVSAMASACERDIHTGDSMDVAIIDKNGIERKSFPLNKD
eukprot:c23156_g1_i1.p1 GENE.c23156_g1_i1~~c23156_g1_i1.p1  ORF type:complete len:255 (-),score=76.69 c23156_g1_i1:161-886(-)